MNFNRETWYSKIIAILLFFAFPVVAFYLGAKYQKSTDYKDKSAIASSPAPAKSKVTFQKSFEDNLLKYKGTVQTPSPCHELKQKTKIMESYPEQVRIDLSIDDPAPGNVCIQQIAQKDFSGKIKVSESATVSVFLNGEKVY
ncbi:MAG: hypothetical protein UU34_C0017G0012 [Candidatus Curtissbacteria bacterium GW2011_GWA1_41_11]|uniref:Uncharacterized protein n=1 Tax=Candidatus Curtissbacteria bacterium GW2011_GWA1_41_11 TaxID=1618409 RepID=A0A0G0UFT6_9BACT|nr:MAG: hypothetical protein UU34_C0017G0012 [Candidatus Curtissbacteria bacterium GW2011_GWA1_41_11]